MHKMNKKYIKSVTSEGYISTTPLPTSQELKEFYAETYYQAPKSSTYQESYDGLELEYKSLKCKILFHALSAAQSTQGKTFLDIGAGEGFLLNEAFSNGYEVTGLDFSAYGVNKFFPHLMPYHIQGEIFESLSCLISSGKKFSVCTSTNVLEHVLNPDLFIRYMNQLVEPNGLLAITVPNDYSHLQLLAQELGHIDDDFWFVPPHHLNYFNTESFINFIKNRDLEILDAFSDFPVDLYLLHTGSNYIKNPKNGFEANRARMQHEILLANKNGLDGYLDYYRAMFKVGLGRDITIIARLIGG
jgi:2-polyprenyl-3-methyl-5-hydroxy-6-metoxy-1,4-benzoquinol methylase